MNRNHFYLSTIAPDAQAIAKQFGLGVEIAEYCTANNMDDQYTETNGKVQRYLTGISKRIFHGPFNELFPCAIDLKAREFAKQRYLQALQLAKQYGAEKIVIHGGFHPWIYYPVWYVDQSILFWQDFLKEKPGVEIVLENVLETDPVWLLDIVKGVNDPRLRLCLDVGHVNVYSKIPIMDWMNGWAPYLSHFHIHNNDGSWDTHSALNCGSIPMRDFLKQAEECCPDATFTLEIMEAESSVRWLFGEQT